MKSKHVTYILLGAAVILMITSIILMVTQDKKAPVIQVGDSDISYEEGNDVKELLKDVHAKDNKDGDLTDEIFVNRIIDLKNGKADVIYAVIDESKNIGKAHRIITYTKKEVEAEQPLVEDQESNDSDQKAENEKKEKKEIVQSGKNPAIWLKENEITIKQGERFNPLSYIQDVQDDKDKKTDLDRRISIEGEYDVNKKGEYSLKYFVMDSDGNQSNIEELLLTVE